MERFAWVMELLDNSLDTRKKKHMAGGILLSVSLLFGGLAFTVITIKMEEQEIE
jgi:hypothetical protein